jgi:hypothetical protein
VSPFERAVIERLIEQYRIGCIKLPKRQPAVGGGVSMLVTLDNSDNWTKPPTRGGKFGLERFDHALLPRDGQPL